MAHIDGSIELTDAQFDFVRKWIAPIKIRGKSKLAKVAGVFSKSSNKKNKEHNKKVKEDFLKYDAAMTALTQQIRDYRTFVKDLGDQDGLDAVDSYEQERISIVTKVNAAPAGEPQFVQSMQEIQDISFGVSLLRHFSNDTPEARVEARNAEKKLIINDGLKFIAKMEEFDDVAGLTKKVAMAELDGENEEKRAKIVAALGPFMQKARQDLNGMLGDVERFDEPDIARRVQDITETLRTKRAPIIALLTQIIAKAASEELGNLVAQENPLAQETGIATRETQRLEDIDKTVVKLDAAKANMAAELLVLSRKLDMDSEDVVTGLAERREIAAQRADLQARQDALAERAAQLQAYKNGAAVRIEKISEALEQQKENLAIAESFLNEAMRDQALEQWLDGEALEQITDQNEIMLLKGGTTDKGDPSEGKLANLQKMIDASRIQVSADARLFLGEPEMTDISEAQHKTLSTMIKAALNLLELNKYAEASKMHDDTHALWQQFLQSRKFALPAVETSPPSLETQMRKEMNAVSLEVERYWAKGGDADRSVLGDTFKELEATFSRAVANTPFDPEELKAGFKILRNGMEIPLPAASEADIAARGKAAETGAKINTQLLKLYKTKQVSAFETQSIDPDHLIKITGEDGNTQYHQILEKSIAVSGDQPDIVDKRQAKDVPRDVMLRLRQQSELLDVLKGSEAAGCAEMITELTAQAEQLLDDVTNGGPDYAAAAKAISNSEKLLAKSEFSVWIPSGISNDKQAFDRFKSNYATTMRPGEARAAAETFEASFTAHAAASKQLKETYKEGQALLKDIETKIGKGGALSTAMVELTASLNGGDPLNFNFLTLDDPEQQAEYDAAVSKIEAAAKTIGAAGDHGQQVQGRLRERHREMQSRLETRAETAMNDVLTTGLVLKLEIETEIERLQAAKGNTAAADPLAFITTLARTLETASAGAIASQKDTEEYETKKKAFEEQIKLVEKEISDKPHLGSKVEYEAVLDGMKKQAELTDANYKKTKDAQEARSQYQNLKPRVDALLKAIQTTQTFGLAGASLFDTAAGFKVLHDNLAKVADAAKSVSDQIKSKTAEQVAAWQQEAEDDAPQERVDQLVAASTQTREILNQVSAARLKAHAVIPSGLQAEIETASKEPNPNLRRKLIPAVREKVLAALRALDARLKSDPCLQVYRDNPFDHGEAWPQFAASRHALEIQVIKRLKG